MRFDPCVSVVERHCTTARRESQPHPGHTARARIAATRHCEERSDEAIQVSGESWIAAAHRASQRHVNPAGLCADG
jgi:hypothetical protein